MVYEPDRFLAVAVTVLLGIIALLILYTILFFVCVACVRLFEFIVRAIESGLRRRSHFAPHRGRY